MLNVAEDEEEEKDVDESGAAKLVDEMRKFVELFVLTLSLALHWGGRFGGRGKPEFSALRVKRDDRSIHTCHLDQLVVLQGQCTLVSVY